MTAPASPWRSVRLLCTGLSAALLLGACASAPAQTVQPGPTAPARTTVPLPPAVAAHGSGYTPHRIYDVAAGVFIDFEALAARAAQADVVFFGERHGHVPGHRLQHALLQALARRGGVTLSLEMFERDVAPVVSGYVAGTVPHESLLAHARPWPRYFPDYHPLIEEARAHGWRVVAANVPRPLANRVAQEGLAALAELAPASRAHVAADIACPDDAYRERFIAEMTRHPSAQPDSPEVDAQRLQRYYEAQCVKDETMAESIVAALVAGATRPVVHMTGAFHSDHGDGIPARVLRRRPGTTMLTLTVITAPDLDAADPAPHRERADYLLFTLPPGT
jgi:uncharacterized iron-regulated protein